MDNEIYTLAKLQHFFEMDVKIKKEMLKISPPNNYQCLDENSLIKYTDLAYETIIFIFNELKRMIMDMFITDKLYFLEKVDILQQEIIKKFIDCSTNINDLRYFYKYYVSYMDKSFIEIVKSECYGYGPHDVKKSISSVRTPNEILHLIHSYVMNNEEILLSIPLINQKNNNFNYPISFRGVTNLLFEQVFLNFPIDLDCGLTDIIGVNDNKLLLMVRDRGHALTIEITLNDDIARIEYFIPKICNIDMVNSLPGLFTKVNDDSVAAVGVIEVDKKNLCNVLYKFISNVPTDNDIVYKTR